LEESQSHLRVLQEQEKAEKLNQEIIQKTVRMLIESVKALGMATFCAKLTFSGQQRARRNPSIAKEIKSTIKDNSRLGRKEQAKLE
jgi:hypothetical protein